MSQPCTDCADCAVVAKGVSRGVDERWARRMQRDTIARLHRIGEGDGVVCPNLHTWGTPRVGAGLDRRPTERQLAQVRREEADMGWRLRRAARRE